MQNDSSFCLFCLLLQSCTQSINETMIFTVVTPAFPVATANIVELVPSVL